MWPVLAVEGVIGIRNTTDARIRMFVGDDLDSVKGLLSQTNPAGRPQPMRDSGVQ